MEYSPDRLAAIVAAHLADRPEDGLPALARTVATAGREVLTVWSGLRGQLLTKVIDTGPGPTQIRDITTGVVAVGMAVPCPVPEVPWPAMRVRQLQDVLVIAAATGQDRRITHVVAHLLAERSGRQDAERWREVWHQHPVPTLLGDSVTGEMLTNAALEGQRHLLSAMLFGELDVTGPSLNANLIQRDDGSGGDWVLTGATELGHWRQTAFAGLSEANVLHLLDVASGSVGNIIWPTPGEGLCICDNRRQIIFTTTTAEVIFDSEIRGIDLRALVSEDQRQALTDALDNAQAAKGEFIRLPIRHVNAAGIRQRLEFGISCTDSHSLGGDLFAVRILDTTGEHAAAVAPPSVDPLFEALDLPMIAVDREGLIVAVNRSFEQMSGLRTGDLHGTPPSHLGADELTRTRLAGIGAGTQENLVLHTATGTVEVLAKAMMVGTENQAGSLWWFLPKPPDQRSGSGDTAIRDALLQARRRDRVQLADQIHAGPIGHLVSARRRLEGAGPGETPVADVLRLLENAEDWLRSLIVDVSDVDDRPLRDRLDDIASEIAADTSGRVSVRHSTDLDESALAAGITDSLALVCRQWVGNIAKHATGATFAEIEIATEETWLAVTVFNDGDPPQAATLQEMSRPGHRGIPTILGEIRALSGEVTLRRAGNQTVFDMRIPTTAAFA